MKGDRASGKKKKAISKVKRNEVCHQSMNVEGTEVTVGKKEAGIPQLKEERSASVVAGENSNSGSLELPPENTTEGAGMVDGMVVGTGDTITTTTSPLVFSSTLSHGFVSGLVANDVWVWRMAVGAFQRDFIFIVLKNGFCLQSFWLVYENLRF